MTSRVNAAVREEVKSIHRLAALAIASGVNGEAAAYLREILHRCAVLLDSATRSDPSLPEELHK